MKKTEVWLFEAGGSPEQRQRGLSFDNFFVTYDSVSGLLLLPRPPDEFRRVTLIEIPQEYADVLINCWAAKAEANRISQKIWGEYLPSLEEQFVAT